MDLKTFYKSRKVKYALAALVGLALMLFVFQAGVVVGGERANFAGHLGDNYSRIFEGGRTGDTRQPLGYGAAGKVISIAGGTLTIATSDNIEKIILVSSDTIIRESQTTATTSDIAVNDSVIVVGSPLPSGEISAKLIRILPSTQ